MNTIFRLGLATFGIACITLSSCQNNKVVVVDSRNGNPISGASVYKKSGNLYSRRHVTDYTGTTPTPQLPGANRWTAVVSKPGYQTVSF